MALVAFFAAQYIVQQSKKGDHATLLNPGQLTLLVGLLGGNGVEPLKDALFYRWSKKERLIAPIPAVFSTFLFITMMGFTIAAVDTWFSVATHPVAHTMFSNRSAAHPFGRQLNRTTCPDGPNDGVSPVSGLNGSHFWPCNVQQPTGLVGGTYTLLKTAEGTKLQHGFSSSTQISSYVANSITWYFYANPNSKSELNFQASTFALSTQCKSMTSKCLKNNQNPGDLSSSYTLYDHSLFKCTPRFQGNLSNLPPYTMSNTSYESYIIPSLDRTGIVFASDAAFTSTPPVVEGKDLSHGLRFNIPVTQYTSVAGVLIIRLIRPHASRH